MDYNRLCENTTTWQGLYEGIDILDSIKDHGFAIKQTNRRSKKFDCYFPYPEDNDYCIHITNISRKEIIKVLKDDNELDEFLNDKQLTIDDIRRNLSIVEILIYIADIYDIYIFFDLDEKNCLVSKQDVSQIVTRSFGASYFDCLLRNHGLNSCPDYLWKIKVTDDEYISLKGYIIEKIQQEADTNLYDREVALLFAEFHRREYDYRNNNNDEEQGPSVLVFQSLGIQNGIISINDFKNIASEGAKRMGIQLYTNGRSTLYIYSLFYHGGLPLNKLFLQPTNPTWHKLIRRLLEFDDPIDFSNFNDLVRSVVANNIYALKAFCQELQNAILNKDYLALPFFCSSENDTRYQSFLNLGQKAIAEIKSKNPFGIAWSYEINMHLKVIRPKYRISGPDSISLNSDFVNDHHLGNRDSFTITAFEDGNELTCAVYNRYQNQNEFYSNQALNIESSYNNISNLSIKCPELIDNNILLSEELDIYSPQLISEDEDGNYVITRNRLIGHKEVLVIIPEGWIVENEQNYHIEDGYSYLGSRAKILFLQKGIEAQSVILSDQHGTKKTISATVPLAKVIVKKIGHIDNLRDNAFFKVQDLEYYIKYSDGRTISINREDLRFCCDRREGIWLTLPPVGHIYVKSCDDSIYADPLRILSMGNSSDDFRIRYLDSDANSCCMSVEWRNCKVACEIGEKIDNYWKVNKDDLEDSRYVEFQLEPFLGKRFSLPIKTKFSDFTIYDAEGNSITNNCYISLAQLPYYNYHIQDINLGINIKIFDTKIDSCREESFTYIINAENNHNDRIDIRILNNNNNEVSERTILKESSLDNLFGGLDKLIDLVNLHQGDMRFTEIEVSTQVYNRPLRFIIKRYPYIFVKKAATLIEIKTRGDLLPVSYSGTVKATPLHEYEGITPVELEMNNRGQYLLPPKVREWGEVLLYSGAGEWVLPHAIDCNIWGERETEENNDRFTSVFLPMRDTEYPNARIWSKTWQRGCYWFEKAYKEHIPAMSLFDLMAIMSSSKLMARFVFNMLLCGLNNGNFNDFKSKLKYALLNMAKDNSFLWIWVHEKDCTFDSLDLNQIDLNVVKGFVQSWYLYKADVEGLARLFRNGGPTEEDTVGFARSFFFEYSKFMDDLRHSSMDIFLSGNNKNLSSREFMSKLNNSRFEVPDDFDDELNALYYNPKEEFYFMKYEKKVSRKPLSFQIFYSRASFFFNCIHKNGDEDLFSYKPSIRRSILYYTSHYKNQFIALCTYNGY